MYSDSPYTQATEAAFQRFQTMMEEVYSKGTNITELERHYYLIRHLAESELHDWAEIGRRLQTAQIELWDVAFRQPYINVIKDGLDANPSEANEMLALITNHLTKEATVLSRGRASHPDFDPTYQYDHTPQDVTPQGEPDPPILPFLPPGITLRPSVEDSVGKLADKIRAVATRSYGMAGRGDQGTFAASLVHDPDPVMQSLGRALLQGTIEIHDVPDHPNVRLMQADAPEAAQELFQRIVDYLYVEIAEEDNQNNSWGLDQDEDEESDSEINHSSSASAPEPSSSEVDPDVMDFDVVEDDEIIDDFDLTSRRKDPWGITKSEEYE